MQNQNPTYRIYELTVLFLFFLPLIIVALYDFSKVWFFAHILFVYSSGLVIALIRLKRKNTEKRIDIEISMVSGSIAIISHFYFPPIIFTINSIIALLAILLFVYRQTRLPIKENILFLSGYGLSYFGLNYKLLDFNSEGFAGFLYSVVWSLFFAYTLLAAKKVKNLYRATFCATASLLGITVLCRRIFRDLYDPIVLIQAIATCLLLYCFIHWNSGKRDAPQVFGKKFFNIEILPHIILFISVICYSFFSSTISVQYAVLGMVVVVLMWWAIFVIKGFTPIFIKRNLKLIPLKQEFKFCFTDKNFFTSYLSSITK